MQNIDKELVKKKFLSALETYDEHAAVQKLAGLELLRELARFAPPKFNKALEIGAGSGRFTKYLNRDFRFGEFFANDLFEESHKFVEKWCQKENFLVCDGENIENLPKNLDLIISNSTFQWFSDLPGFLNSVHSRLNKGAIVAFTTFGPLQFREIREITDNSLEYIIKEELIKLINSRYQILFFNEWKESMKFASVKRILKHISSTGVSAIPEKKSSMDFETFQKKYKEKFFDGRMYDLTYHPQIWILKAV